MIKLQLLRHAKTDQYSSTGRDFDRKLLPKGKKQAELMCTYFEKEALRPTEIWCSTAQRTRETLAGVFPAANHITYRDDLYLTGGKNMFQAICEKKQGNSLLVIGHNNGISDLASYLSDRDILLRTCEFIELTFDCEQWSEISQGMGKITLSYHPVP